MIQGKQWLIEKLLYPMFDVPSCQFIDLKLCLYNQKSIQMKLDIFVVSIYDV
jgi:hypothetical protein